MKVFLLVLALLIIAPAAHAAFLVTDPMVGVILYDVEIDGVIVEAIAAQPDGSLKYDVSSLAVGPHTFRVKPTGQGGWPATFSPPFDTAKPATASGLKIVP